MKKLLCLTALSMALCACSATTHTGIEGTKFSDVVVETRPLQVSVVPGEKITGSARCRSFLFFTIDKPEKEAYGATMQTDSGNFESGLCTRGAIYNAISNAKADVLLAPQYTVKGKTFACLFGHCVYSDSIVYVTGYKGTFKNIQDMPEDVIKERFKNVQTNNTDAPAGKSGGFFKSITKKFF